MITLRFVGGKSFISDTIKRFEYGFWASHAEAIMPDGTIVTADIKKGVVNLPMNYNAESIDRELVVHVPATPDQTDKFYAFLRDQIGKPYDDKAVIGLGLGRDWRSPDSWFCSELDAAALCACGIFPPHLADELNHVTPRDLLLILSGRADVSVPMTIPAPDAQPV